jgi:hypothetical protein
MSNINVVAIHHCLARLNYYSFKEGPDRLVEKNELLWPDSLRSNNSLPAGNRNIWLRKPRIST